MKKSVKFITRSALIAALYLVLSIAFQAISFGPIQFRVSEIMVLLPIIMPEAIPGLTIGCFLTNFFFSPYGIYDVILGTIATLLGSILTFALRKNILVAALPPIILNAVLIPIVYIIDNSGIYYIAMFEILLSELIAAGVLAIPLTSLLKKALIRAHIVSPISSKYDSNPYVREENIHDDIE